MSYLSSVIFYRLNRIMAEENETNGISEKENEAHHDLNNENDVELIDLSNEGMHFQAV